MPRKLIEEYAKWELEVNLNKTEYTCIGRHQQDLLPDNSQHMKRCTGHKYLGLKITQNETLHKTILARNINVQSCKANAMLNSILGIKVLGKRIRRRYTILFARVY